MGDRRQRGWYLGKDTFRDKLLKMLERPAARRTGGTRRTAGVHRDHGEKEALRILREGARHLGFPPSLPELSRLKKSDERKTQLAILLRNHTSMSNEWIAGKLAMGHPGSVSRTVSAGRSDNSLAKKIRNLEMLLIREQ